MLFQLFNRSHSQPASYPAVFKCCCWVPSTNKTSCLPNGIDKLYYKRTRKKHHQQACGEEKVGRILCKSWFATKTHLLIKNKNNGEATSSLFRAHKAIERFNYGAIICSSSFSAPHLPLVCSDIHIILAIKCHCEYDWLAGSSPLVTCSMPACLPVRWIDDNYIVIIIMQSQCD